MPRKAKQLPLNFNKGKWGGARKNAGRPRKIKAIVHEARPVFSSHHPLHITVRVRKGVPSLRSKTLFNDFKTAVACARERGLRIIHFSLLSNHIHMIIEASNKKELEGGMKSLLISLAWRLKTRELQGVFENRYHLTVLKSPTQTRNALRYVLLNEEKHSGHQPGSVLKPRYSPYNTCALFSDWSKLLGWKVVSNAVVFSKSPWSHVVNPPRTWLLREGWKRSSMKCKSRL